MTRGAPLLIAALLAAAAPARAQTMLDQEQRLIEIHSLLLDLPAVQAPGAYRAGQVSLGVELITIPPIDGTTGGKRQLTASDHTPLFPRPRLAVGLPAPEGFRAFAGAAYIPPISISEVSTHHVAGEAGIAYAPGHPPARSDGSGLRVGLRGHVLYAESEAPVSEPDTRDTLHTFGFGADLSSGYAFALGPASLTPYAGLGVTRVSGRYRVTSDGVVLTSDYTGLAVQAGVRLFVKGWEAVVELDAFPGRLVHPSFRLGYALDLHNGAGR